jgi:hypothetical protein
MNLSPAALVSAWASAAISMHGYADPLIMAVD